MPRVGIHKTFEPFFTNAKSNCMPREINEVCFSEVFHFNIRLMGAYFMMIQYQ